MFEGEGLKRAITKWWKSRIRKRISQSSSIRWVEEI